MENNLNVSIPYSFTPRFYQIPFLEEVEKAISGESEKRFFYLIWHRRSGKDRTNIAMSVPLRLIKDPCLVKYIYPTLVMGRDNLWNGIGSDGFRYLDHIPKALRIDTPFEPRTGSRMLLEVVNQKDPDTPSIFQVGGTDNPDSLRGGNPKLVVFSEWAEQDPYAWDVVEPILRENKGIAIFNTTPRGDNHARSLFEFAKNNPSWWVETLTYKDTKVFTDAEYEQILADAVKRFEADGRSEEEAIAYCEQEYLCSFDSPVIGSYYGAAIMKAERENRIINVPYEQQIPVDTYWDLGIDDSMTIWFGQTVGMEIRFIDYYENSGEGLPHYAIILQEKGYLYRRHYAPHDISVRELGTGKSRLEIAKGLGIRFTPVAKLDIDDGINAARSLFNQCWFDKNKCSRGIQALKNYKKDWDDKNKVFRNQPLHNWASHGADAFRTFAVGYKRPFLTQPKSQQDVGGVKPYWEGLPG